MKPDLIYALAGAALLLAVVLPVLLRRLAISAPIVLVAVGAGLGLLPGSGDSFSPTEKRELVEHLAELTVIVALMGVGLALDRPLSWRRFTPWRRWDATWRLLALAMPATIAAVALLGWWAMGLAPAAALLLGAALAPTDPVLASDVQVSAPSATSEDPEEIDERDEVRFALTSEAGLNDGLAFPFAHAAVLLATTGPVTEWGLTWLAWDLVGMVVVGIAIGTATGWALSKVAFGRRERPRDAHLAEVGEPLLALAAVLLSYGLAELAQGYGFLAVFVCAMTLRSAERGSEYHQHMHGTIARLEQLLTLAMLLLLGISLSNGLLEPLTWAAASVGVLLVLVIRPLTAFVALRIGPRTHAADAEVITRGETTVIAFFGVRGIGSLFYLAWALGETSAFGDEDLLWATVGFTIVLSVLVHGIAATPVMRRLDIGRERVAAEREQEQDA